MAMPVMVTNYATNPRPGGALDTGAGEWSYVAGTGEAGSSAPVATAGPLGLPGFARRTITTAKSAGDAGWRYSEASAGGAGSARDVSLYVRSSSTIDVALRVQFLLGGVDAGTADEVAVTVPANVWTRISGTGGATDPFDEVRAWARVTGALPFGTFDAACILLDPGDIVPIFLPYPSVFLFPNDFTYPTE